MRAVVLCNNCHLVKDGKYRVRTVPVSKLCLLRSMSRVYRVKHWKTRRELFAGSLDQCVKFINSGKCAVNVTVTSFVGEQ